MPHTQDEWNSQRWGTAVDWSQQSLVALDITNDQLILLPPRGADAPLPDDPGGATARNRAQRHELVCPVLGCGPLIAVGPRDARHHFRHPKGYNRHLPGHDPESREHLAAKIVLATWLRAQAGAEMIRLEVDSLRLVTRRGQVVKPDVYAELSNGVRIAIEYQYSPGSTVTLVSKHLAYAEIGVVAWWMYGPGPRTCRVDRSAPHLQVVATACQNELAGLGGSFFWFDPWRRRVGTPVVRSRVLIRPRQGETWLEDPPVTRNGYVRQPYTAGWRGTLSLWDSSLDECVLDVDTGALVTRATSTAAHGRGLAAVEIDRLRAEARDRYRTHSSGSSAPQESSTTPVTGSRRPPLALAAPQTPSRAPQDTNATDTSRASSSVSPALSPDSRSRRPSPGSKPPWRKVVDWLRRAPGAD